MRRTLSIALVVATLGLVGCSGSSGGSSSTPSPVPPSTTSSPSSTVGTVAQATPIKNTSGLPEVKQVVENKKYEFPQLSINADKPRALEFENKDDGVSHSMVIYNDSDFPLDTSAQVLFSFAPFPGDATNVYVIPPLNKGTYLFQCAVHQKMQGTIFVGIR